MYAEDRYDSQTRAIDDATTAQSLDILISGRVPQPCLLWLSEASMPDIQRERGCEETERALHVSGLRSGWQHESDTAAARGMAVQ